MAVMDRISGTREQVYATLLLTDSYLPGALVLGHSLRDARTTRKLAVLVTLDSVSADAITQLQAVYDYILPVPRIRNDHPAKLLLMNRADLHSAFTKISLWKQTQFSKIVYVDADVVAYRAPDELFELDHNFSAAPDIGWPDLFNTGVMALTPNMGDYYAMLAMAERGISFDGADQGLLNMHFKHSVNRLPFTYNVTPSGHYQYVPAYRHFQSSISMVHFIGANKPWFSGRESSGNDSPFDEMVGRWWAVYDRHFREQERSSYSASTGLPRSHQAATLAAHSGSACSAQSGQVHTVLTTAHRAEGSSLRESDASSSGRGLEGVSIQGIPGHHREVEVSRSAAGEQSSDNKKPHVPQLDMSSWDAQRQPPPTDSKPEAINFPATHYEMSQDTNHFVPPERYPSPPRDMWYEVPKERPAAATEKPRAIFPWEGSQPKPTRTFHVPSTQKADQDTASSETSTAPVIQVTGGPAGEGPGPSQEGQRTEDPSESLNSPPSSTWSSFSLVNAWDDMPEIGRYVEGLKRHRRTKSQEARLVATQGTAGAKPGRSKPPTGLKLTDFPTEVERPSLPVTPAPIRRPSFWGDDTENQAVNADIATLPTAEGVPSQLEWDPSIQLQALAQQQSEVLLRKLSRDDDAEGAKRELPSRPLPFGSESLYSPTYVAQSAAPKVLSPQPIKGKGAAAGLVQDLTEGDRDTDAGVVGETS